MSVKKAMKCFFLVFASVEITAHAIEPSAFTPPRPYDASRYEALWEKNPFTLGTTPVVQQRSSFAEPLVIASVYGNLADPTVVLANVKTHERIRLRASQADGSGLKLVRLHTGNGKRDDMLAIVSLGEETSEIHYGTDYLKQVMAAGAAKATQAVLQKRQQSLSQHSGSAAPLPTAAGGVNSVAGPLPGSAPLQDAGLLAGSFHQSAAGGSTGGQKSSMHTDNHTSSSSLAEELSGAMHMPLRRYTFRSGDEIPVPNPDPQ